MKTRQQAILQSGHGELSKGIQNEKIFCADYFPHDYLFARATCVIHHCGAGTCATVVKTGVSSIPVPHAFDQFYNAKILEDLGIATPSLPKARLAVKALSKAIKQIICCEELQKNHVKSSQMIQLEDGTGEAVRLIEALMKK